jgi:hypothetical protein
VLRAGVPVFVHITPEYEGTAAASFVPESRRFFRASDLAPKLAALRTAWTLDPDAALGPEREALTALFGDRREPISIEDALSSDRARDAAAGHGKPHGAQTT